MGRISGSVGAQKTRYQSINTVDLPSSKRRRVGLLYDDRMCKHFNSADHVENPNRILSVWNKLQSSGINQRCIVLNAKEAEDGHIALVHSKKHMDLIKNISSPTKYDNRKRSRAANHLDSIYFNEGSSEAALLAAGSVVEVAEKVAKGELDSGFAIVRPPGHHAEANKPMGFCLLNNVAIAASYVVNERKDLGIRKILIVDWDVHHGNGTQKMFWKDPRVLVFSVHRHENGTFYPGGNDGSYQNIGEGPGAGYNINVPWENDGCGDADYVAAWDHVLIPVAKAFDPDLIIVSAGFDAAINDSLGGCCVTPYGFSIMLSKLMEFAHGKIVMALEGGYDLESLVNSSLACVETLLDGKPVVGSLTSHPLESTLGVIQAVREQLRPYWPILSNQLPVVEESIDTPGKLAKCHEDLKVQASVEQNVAKCHEDLNEQNVASEKKDKRIKELESKLEQEHSAKAVLQSITTRIKGEVHALKAERASLHGLKAEQAFLEAENTRMKAEQGPLEKRGDQSQKKRKENDKEKKEQILGSRILLELANDAEVGKALGAAVKRANATFFTRAEEENAQLKKELAKTKEEAAAAKKELATAEEEATAAKKEVTDAKVEMEALRERMEPEAQKKAIISFANEVLGSRVFIDRVKSLLRLGNVHQFQITFKTLQPHLSPEVVAFYQPMVHENPGALAEFDGGLYDFLQKGVEGLEPAVLKFLNDASTLLSSLDIENFEEPIEEEVANQEEQEASHNV